MRILRLTDLKIEPMEASCYTKIKDGETKRYYNVRHGSDEPGFHAYTCGLDVRYFKPETNSDVYRFTDDDYSLRQLYAPSTDGKKKPLIDGLGNPFYLISKDRIESSKKDMIIFWEIPNKNFISCNYTLKGMVTEVAKGYIGKKRNNVTYKVPAPVLEVIGSCELTWEAVNADNQRFSQTIKYDTVEDRWDIGILTNIEGGN